MAAAHVDVGALLPSEPEEALDGDAQPSAAPLPGGAQIDVPDLLADTDAEPAPRQRRFVKNSLEHVRNAQKGRIKAAAKKREEKLRAKAAVATEAVRQVTTALPVAAKLIGVTPARRVTAQKREPRVDDFNLLVRAAHLPSKERSSIGIKRRRLTHAASKLVVLGLGRLTFQIHLRKFWFPAESHTPNLASV